MAVTETVTESWGSRLGGAFKGILAGLVLFVAGFPLLWWNEGRSVQTAKALDEGEGACVSLASPATVDPSADGRLVHLSGLADTQEILRDDAFGVAVRAVKLNRQVEMYQWVERSSTKTKKNLGGSETRTTTYTYEKSWVNGAVDSSRFREEGHENPGTMEFESKSYQAEEVRLGAYRLNPSQVASMGSAQAYAFPADFTSGVARAQVRGSQLYVPNRETRQNALNTRDVVAQPRVGDLRVSYSVVLPHKVSVIAQQEDDTFVPYVARTGKTVSLLRDGVRSAAEMFATARSENTVFTWLLRLVGFVLMMAGLSQVLKPLVVLGDVVPFIGTVIGIGTGFVAGTVAFVCALVTIALAWLFYRPVLGIGLLALAGLGIFALITRKNKVRASKPTAP